MANVPTLVKPFSLLINPEHGAAIVDVQGTLVASIEKVEGWVERSHLMIEVLNGTPIGAERPGLGLEPVTLEPYQRFRELEIG